MSTTKCYVRNKMLCARRVRWETAIIVQGLVVQGLVVQGLVVQGLVVQGLVVQGLVVQGLVVQGLVVQGAKPPCRVLRPFALSPSALGPRPFAPSPRIRRVGYFAPSPSALSPQPSALGPQPSALGPRPSAQGAKPPCRVLRFFVGRGLGGGARRGGHLFQYPRTPKPKIPSISHVTLFSLLTNQRSVTLKRKRRK